MLNNNNNYLSFNNFRVLPLFPYKMVEHLIKNADENFWKLLKYQTTDALEKDDLTIKEKKAMIWDGSKPDKEEDYNIFLQPLIGNSLDSAENQCQLRIFRYDTVPTTAIESEVIYEIDIITQEKSAMVYYEDMLSERTDLIEYYLLDVLNGADISGTGVLVFDRQFSRTCKSLLNISNSKSFYGRSLFLGQRLIDPDNGGGC